MIKLVKMFDHMGQMYGKQKNKIDLSSWYFSTKKFSEVVIHVLFYVRTHTALTNNIL